MIFSFITGTIAGIIIHIVFKKLTGKHHSDAPNTEKGASLDIKKIYEIADKIEDLFYSSAHPRDLLENNDFKDSILLFTKKEVSVNVLIDYSMGGNPILSCMALEAMRSRIEDEKFLMPIIEKIGMMQLWPLFFLLRTISEVCKSPAICMVLSRAPQWWVENPILPQFLNNFINERLKQGEKPSFTGFLNDISSESLNTITDLLKILDSFAIKELVSELEELSVKILDKSFLQSIGSLWEGFEQKPIIYEHEYLKDSLARIESSILSEQPRSVLLIGEQGTGKTTLVKSFAAGIKDRKMLIFEAGATEILAGQIYIGELEQRIKDMTFNLNKKRGVIWYIPNFHELFFAGKSKYNPLSVLDMIMPYIESGLITVIGETVPESYEKLSRENRRIDIAFEKIEVLPLDDHETLKLAMEWITSYSKKSRKLIIDENTLPEALLLSRQFAGNKAAPGNLVGLLEDTLRRLDSNMPGELRIDLNDIFTTLSRQTGLPRSILDNSEGLSLDSLKEIFDSRVKGQPEAVTCLIDRIAMIKAGLTDMTRSLGVFLFAGPTGTGKTEIARALSQYLFGSEERMIRIDMSELKTERGIERLTGSMEEGSSITSLTGEIRKQPFSVILLDEFEKAHPNVWDLFLQVFDDGRLTDSRGNLADFRHAIIIITSNVGSTINSESIGFSSTGYSFSFSGVEKRLRETFRREFLNRIDRIVIFRPLERSIMREILDKELGEMIKRRGLRNREWAIEWDHSATEFLLEKGFTPDMGARPLKRAIDRYLLTPLAKTIVEKKVPEGDQFLFIRSDGSELTVEFIDPDADENAFTREEDKEAPVEGEHHSHLKLLISHATGTDEEARILEKEYKDLEKIVRYPRWDEKKKELLSMTSETGFWESDERFGILSEAEYMDRVESGFKTAHSLLSRLTGNNPKKRTNYSITLLNRLAHHLYLLNHACITIEKNLPKDTFIRLSSTGKIIEEDRGREFMKSLFAMYKKWGKKRRMRLEVLKEDFNGKVKPAEVILAVSGFGSYSILMPEHGVHLLEEPGKGKSFTRHRVTVMVAPQPEIPIKGASELLKHSEIAFPPIQEESLHVVRKYRLEPSPLVRDSVREWRTGRVQSVFEGDFDIIG